MISMNNSVIYDGEQTLRVLLLKHHTTDPNFHMMNFVVADIVKIRCHENFRVCDRGSRSVIWQANLLIY